MMSNVCAFGVLVACLLTVRVSASTCPTTCSMVPSYCNQFLQEDGASSSLLTNAPQQASQNCSITNETGWFLCWCGGTDAYRNVSVAVGMCTMEGDSQQGDGAICDPTIGECPLVASCATAEPVLSEYGKGCADGRMQCTDDGDGFFTVHCYTCNAERIQITNVTAIDKGQCRRTITAPSTPCDPAVACSGHGCCIPEGASSSSSSSTSSVCKCFDDDINGHWDGSKCSECDIEYTNGEEGKCLAKKEKFVLFLTTLGTNSLAMTLPTLVGVLLFMVLSVLRRRWPSDEEYGLTVRRRTGLTTVADARPTNGRTFHSKLIPKRPAGSRGMVNRREILRQDMMQRGAVMSNQNIVESL